ncbi:S-layer homology domain-containing protein [Geomicrobium sp. JCM 19055]|uniref:S-layer homology domain-containing protein n=1 Tax=Geomicrobium sp. JCM 19055 TaxID=1460649 RepID=UPI00045ED709|nr:S-layer homology domain-containing protein [Geomicrobium sp. JCM 19055]GAJ97428.1 hypothetical protein JCM19055_286 [Geomicrobium sp. JCM 19055]
MAYQPKTYRKFIAGTMTAAMAATAFAATTPQQVADAQEFTFTDVDASNVHLENIERAVERGYVQGHPDNTYRPGVDISRGQIATMLVRALNLEVDEDIEEAVFNDVQADNNFAPVVKAVSEAGIMNGINSDQFAPTRDLSREQMATIIVRAFDLERDESIDVVVNDLALASSSHSANIEILSQYGITSTTDNNFRPKEPVRRDQMATFLERTFDHIHTEEAGLEDIQAINNNSVEVTFADDVNVEELTAEQFSFNNDLEVLDVEVTDENAVTLTTTEQDSETTYTLSFDGERTTLSFAGSDEVVEEVELAIESLVVDNDGFTTSVSAEVLGSDDETEAHVAIVDADGEVVTEEVVSVEEGAIEADFAGLLAGEYKAVVTIDNEEEDVVAEADFDISNLVLPLEVAEATTTQVRPAEDQELAFTVDGISYDLADLVEAGYEIEYFFNKEGLEMSEEGTIKVSEDVEEFSYAVRITDAEDEERTVTSNRQEVEVVSATVIAEITEAALVSGEDVIEGNVITSNTDAKFEVISAVNGYGEEIDFEEDDVEKPVVEKAVSSDVTIAHYNTEEGIIVQGEGEVEFEVHFEGIEEAVEVVVTVVADEEITEISNAGSTVRMITNDGKVATNLTNSILDQYGNVWAKDQTVTVTVTGDEDLKVERTEETKDGEISVDLNEYIEEEIEAGTYTVSYAIDDLVLGEVTVEVIELDLDSVDQFFLTVDEEETMDLYDTEENKLATEVHQTVTIGAEFEGIELDATELASALGDLEGSLKLTTSNADIVSFEGEESADISNTTSDFTVTGEAEGTAIVSLVQVEGDFVTTIAATDITVENSTPQITEITLEDEESPLRINAEGHVETFSPLTSPDVEVITDEMIEDVVFVSSQDVAIIYVSEIYGGGVFTVEAVRANAENGQ